MYKCRRWTGWRCLNRSELNGCRKLFLRQHTSSMRFEHELHALDYLLKPFDQARFKDAIKYAKERFRSDRHNEGRMQLSALLENIKNKAQYLERLVIKAAGRITFLRTDEINWIEADDKYVHLHTSKASPMVRQTLSAMEAQLDPAKFRRVRSEERRVGKECRSRGWRDH